MTKRWYQLQFYSANGVWVDMPETDEPVAVASLVEALLKCRKAPGEFIRINIREEYRES